MKKYAIIIHGGCGSYDINDPLEAKHQAAQDKGLQKAIALGWKLLQKNTKALDVVEKVVTMLELDPAFNAGIGAAIGIDGQVSLDASIMDGTTLQCGGVAALDGIPTAISVARKIMEETWHVMLVEKGANTFAKNHGFKKIPTKQFYTPYQIHWLREFKKDQKRKPRKETVGIAVLDSFGTIAAGTSTGGLTGKMQGRVGDSPIIGAGTYAVSQFGGASATGNGEQILQVGLTRTVVDFMRFKKLSAMRAAEKSISELAKLPNGFGGVICVSAEGEIGFAANETYLPRAYMTSKMKKPIIAFAMD